MSNPNMDTPFDLSAVVREWKHALIDVGGNNRLLFHRDTASVIDLGQPSPAIVKLLRGEVVRLTELVEAGPALTAMKRACASIARKEREAREEYGVSVSYLAVGLATWDPTASKGIADALDEEASSTSGTARSGSPRRDPLAPVLLRSAEVRRRQGAQDSWEVQLVDDFQFNGVLAHVINSDKARLDPDDVEAIDGTEWSDVEFALDLVAEKCADIAEFSIAPRLMIGTFTYMKQPMVSDISDFSALKESPLVRALAGDARAVAEIREVRDSTSERTPDYAPVDSEFLVLDADASQSYVVNAALAGRSLVVQGPPGTGKSQTIANLIAALIADGKSVLFVAQKRAAVEAVLNRLDSADLAHLVLDLFAATGSRRFVAEQLREVLDRQQTALKPEVGSLHAGLTTSRDHLVAYHDQLHAQVHGWGLSIADLRARIAGSPGVLAPMAIPARVFNGWDDARRTEMGAHLDELAAIGALSAAWETQAGWNPLTLTTAEDERYATQEVQDLAYSYVAKITYGIEQLKAAVQLREPLVWNDLVWFAQSMVAAARARRQSAAVLDAGVPDDKLALMRAALDGRYGQSQGLKVGWRDRRRMAREARELVGPTARRAKDLAAVIEQAQWIRTACVDPLSDDWLAVADDLVKTITEALLIANSVSPKLRGIELGPTPLGGMAPLLGELASDPRKSQMPRVAELKQKMWNADLGPLLTSLGNRDASMGGFSTAPSVVLDSAVYHSLLREALSNSPAAAGTSAEVLNQAVKTYNTLEPQHLAANAARVRRLAAERFAQALDSHEEQHILLRTEVNRKRNFRPLRVLFSKAPDVMLAAKPVWAMSPLQVSRVLPLQKCFDVVVFDEASQVRPADAVPALARASQAVIAGDSRQLPPTDFFSKVLEDPLASDYGSTDDDESASLDANQAKTQTGSGEESHTRDAESVLAAFERVLAGQARRLLWHYRSRDERLIAVSNAVIYDASLTTFPAAHLEHGLRYEPVEPSWGASKTTNSPDNEVMRVVELVEEHVASRPLESLGVITFGERHQRRVSDALDRRAQVNSLLLEFMEAEGVERFFVKNIERVQGDERDAIIVSVGYGKTPQGRMRMLWGPLLQEGGERRLNVAISRAKNRMTLVTSFVPDDLAPDGHSSAGYRLMYAFVRFMASNGSDLGPVKASTVPLNPFEIDIRDRLEAEGMLVDTQYGVGGYRLDFAVRDPENPGRHVLAIEADGASYHSGYTARERDRLRQTLLERRGWRFHRIWSPSWFNDPDAEMKNVLVAYESALAAAASEAVSQPSLSADESEVEAAWSEGVARRTVLRPPVRPGLGIDEYAPRTLEGLIEHYRSDGVVRTREEELEWVVRELGFSRKGTKIVAAIRAAQAKVDQLK